MVILVVPVEVIPVFPMEVILVFPGEVKMQMVKVESEFEEAM